MFPNSTGLDFLLWELGLFEEADQASSLEGCEDRPRLTNTSSSERRPRDKRFLHRPTLALWGLHLQGSGGAATPQSSLCHYPRLQRSGELHNKARGFSEVLRSSSAASYRQPRSGNKTGWEEERKKVWALVLLSCLNVSSVYRCVLSFFLKQQQLHPSCSRRPLHHPSCSPPPLHHPSCRAERQQFSKHHKHSRRSCPTTGERNAHPLVHNDFNMFGNFTGPCEDRSDRREWGRESTGEHGSERGMIERLNMCQREWEFFWRPERRVAQSEPE
ncbi:unnamed protein product [Pleuronectes platessa]|uniref:Uncharacterized protein n=1 Tax=Pleuronectes platessa TaxID=8262 RepID=A0A9N7UEZ3_PLEPL|nr:unnamed protein product [Pleuronectes platessa]